MRRASSVVESVLHTGHAAAPHPSGHPDFDEAVARRCRGLASALSATADAFAAMAALKRAMTRFAMAPDAWNQPWEDK